MEGTLQNGNLGHLSFEYQRGKITEGENLRQKNLRQAPEIFNSGILLPTMSWEPVKISEAICLIEHPLFVLISLVSFLISSS